MKKCVMCLFMCLTVLLVGCMKKTDRQRVENLQILYTTYFDAAMEGREYADMVELIDAANTPIEKVASPFEGISVYDCYVFSPPGRDSWIEESEHLPVKSRYYLHKGGALYRAESP